MSTNPSGIPPEYDGLLLCNGVDAEKEAAPYINKGLVQAVVSRSIQRYRFNQETFLFALDGAGMVFDMLEAHPDKEFITIPKWNTKTGEGRKLPTSSDFPFLINTAHTMFTALHYLMCRGCKHIYGAGVNLKHWPSGGYESVPSVDGTHLFDTIKRRFEEWIKPCLIRDDITFTSDALNT